jgi:hypothetical protein
VAFALVSRVALHNLIAAEEEGYSTARGVQADAQNPGAARWRFRRRGGSLQECRRHGEGLVDGVIVRLPLRTRPRGYPCSEPAVFQSSRARSI